MIELTKPFIVVYHSSKEIEIKLTNNISTFPGIGLNYAEFDTQEELEQFILDNELVES